MFAPVNRQRIVQIVAVPTETCRAPGIPAHQTQREHTDLPEAMSSGEMTVKPRPMLQCGRPLPCRETKTE